VDAALFNRENEIMARACLNVSATADSSYVVCSWDVRAGAASSGEDDGSVKVAIRSPTARRRAWLVDQRTTQHAYQSRYCPAEDWGRAQVLGPSSGEQTCTHDGRCLASGGAGKGEEQCQARRQGPLNQPFPSCHGAPQHPRATGGFLRRDQASCQSRSRPQPPRFALARNRGMDAN